MSVCNFDVYDYDDDNDDNNEDKKKKSLMVKIEQKSKSVNRTEADCSEVRLGGGDNDDLS
eukprot:scaffold35116_cov30-Cyclotella_meneghiniana.AAC.3